MNGPVRALAGSTSPRGRVAMLVTNPCVNDSRVIRAAESVAALGFEVIVLATAAPGVPEIEERNGVLYRRLGTVRQAPIPPAADPAPEGGVLADAPAGLCPVTAGDAAAAPGGATDPSRMAKTIGSDGAMIEIVEATCAAQDAASKAEERLDPLRRVLRFGKRVLWQVRRSLRLLYRFLWRAGRRSTAFLRRSSRRIVGFFRKSRRDVRARVTRGIQGARRQVGVAAVTQRTEFLFRQALDELKPDIIHAHDFVTLPTGARAARRHGALCIYDSHELEMHRNIVRGSLDRWLCGRIEARYIRRVDAVVTVCDSIADHLAREYGIARPEVVMNAPDAQGLVPIGRDVRSDLGLAPDTPLAIYVGRITVGRGIETLARALRHMPGVHLALLGAVNAPTLAAAEEIVRRDGTADRFHPLAPVPPSAVLPYISSADVSVVPIENVCLSYFYCLPNKLIESTIAGLPVVVSDFPEMRRYVELGQCGLTMDSEDPASIARAVDEAYRRRFELRLDAERRALVEEHYGWETQRQRLSELYERLWQGRGRQAVRE